MPRNDLTADTDRPFLVAAKSQGRPRELKGLMTLPRLDYPLTNRPKAVPAEAAPHTSDSSHRTSTTARNGIYQQAWDPVAAAHTRKFRVRIGTWLVA